MVCRGEDIINSLAKVKSISNISSFIHKPAIARLSVWRYIAGTKQENVLCEWSTGSRISGSNQGKSELARYRGKWRDVSFASATKSLNKK
jgi:hypothetical protein